jgi:hypothetical protein
MNTRLERWSLRSRPFGLLQPPEEEDVCLFGVVVGHPCHRDGKEVLTSPVMHYGAKRIVTKSGSEYELGLVDPSYERFFPGAFERLLSRLEMGSRDLACAAQPMS